jgi:acetyl esterase/lipase
MRSLRASLVYASMKASHYFRYGRKKNPIDWNNPASINYFRQETHKTAVRLDRPIKDVQVQPIQIGDMQAELIRPDVLTDNKIMLLFHGGGYVAGDCFAYRMAASRLAQLTQTQILLFEYRLAPEHPFPAALEDALQAYAWLLEQGHQASDVVFVGDSAGGGLCLATLLALKNEHLSLPMATVAMSPWTDLTCSSPSIQTNAKKCLLPTGCMKAFSQYYAGNQDVKNPLRSPLFGDFHGLPPLLVFVGGNEILLDDSVQFVKQAKAQGVDAQLVVADGLFHCYPYFAPVVPEANVAVAKIRDFIRAVV